MWNQFIFAAIFASFASGQSRHLSESPNAACPSFCADGDYFHASCRNCQDEPMCANWCFGSGITPEGWLPNNIAALNFVFKEETAASKCGTKSCGTCSQCVELNSATARSLPLCACDNRGRFENADGDWCFLELFSCQLLNGEKAPDTWTWARCDLNGAAQVQCPPTNIPAAGGQGSGPQVSSQSGLSSRRVYSSAAGLETFDTQSDGSVGEGPTVSYVPYLSQAYNPEEQSSRRTSAINGRRKQ